VVKRRLAAFNELIAEIGKTRESQGTFPALARVFKIIKAHLFLVSDAILFARSLDDTLPDVQLDDALTIREATMDDLVLFEPTSTPSEMMYIRTELAGLRLKSCHPCISYTCPWLQMKYTCTMALHLRPFGVRAFSVGCTNGCSTCFARAATGVHLHWWE
jgi:hypothetical protein